MGSAKIAAQVAKVRQEITKLLELLDEFDEVPAAKKATARK